jgi:hypothetical protein
MSALWTEYGYEVADTTHDDEGNPMVEMTIYLQIGKGVDRADIVSKIDDTLERGLR